MGLITLLRNVLRPPWQKPLESSLPPNFIADIESHETGISNVAANQNVGVDVDLAENDAEDASEDAMVDEDESNVPVRYTDIS
jgi:hypothetical protein